MVTAAKTDQTVQKRVYIFIHLSLDCNYAKFKISRYASRFTFLYQSTMKTEHQA